ncbi:MAG: hypothetical protein ACI4QE_03630 [Acutalibacteraceae bacterium]
MNKSKFIILSIIVTVMAMAVPITVSAETEATYATTSPNSQIYYTTEPTYYTTAPTYQTYATTTAYVYTTAPTYQVYSNAPETTAETALSTEQPTTQPMSVDPYDTTSAADTGAYNTYRLSDLSLSLNLPKTMTVITRETESTDKFFKSKGNSYKKTMSEFEENDIYLKGYSRDNTQILTVTMTKDEDSQSVFNYSNLTEEQLDQVKSVFLEDKHCQSCTIDNYDEVIYFDLILKDGTKKNPTYFAQSNTVVNGMNINITLQSLDGEISDSDRTMMQNVLGGAKFAIVDTNSKNNDMGTFIWVIIIVVALCAAAGTVLFMIYKKRQEMALKAARSGLYVTDQSEIPKEEEKAEDIADKISVSDDEEGFFDGVEGIKSPKDLPLGREGQREGQTPVKRKKAFVEDEFIGAEESPKKSVKNTPKKNNSKKSTVKNIVRNIKKIKKNYTDRNSGDGGRRF